MLLGRNGAGKTTTLRTIMGLWQATRGTLQFDAQAVRPRPPEMARRGIAYVPENMGIFGGLTVKENILLAARGVRRAARQGSGHCQAGMDLRFPPRTAKVLALSCRKPFRRPEANVGRSARHYRAATAAHCR
nr:ATP-binding cassette domain-containing protein [Bordetella holmesii]